MHLHIKDAFIYYFSCIVKSLENLKITSFSTSSVTRNL